VVQRNTPCEPGRLFVKLTRIRGVSKERDGIIFQENGRKSIQLDLKEKQRG